MGDELGDSLAGGAATSEADAPEPAANNADRAALTFWYTVVVGCMGLTMGAQGPATLKLAEQCGFVTVTRFANGTEAVDTTDLPLMGVATGFDALAGVAGCVVCALLVERHPQCEPPHGWPSTSALRSLTR